MDGDDIPRPSKLTDIDSQAIAKDLDPDAPVCESLVSMVSVDAALYAKEHFEKSVKKLLQFRHGSIMPHWKNFRGRCDFHKSHLPLFRQFKQNNRIYVQILTSSPYLA